MCDGCTRREFNDRQQERIRQMAALALQMQSAFWHPLRFRQLRQQVTRLNIEAEWDYAEHMTRDSEGRLTFECPA